MYNADTDLLFPPRIIASLAETRGKAWQRLVMKMANADDSSVDRLGFILMMARLDGCTSCSADSFRAMHGCTPCAKQALKRFRGTDEDLKALFESTKSEVERYLQRKI